MDKQTIQMGNHLIKVVIMDKLHTFMIMLIEIFTS